MTLTNIKPSAQDMGGQMYEMISELYPICRSITGDGVRETLKIIEKYIPVQAKEVPTGTRVFDWTVPKEWNIKAAYIKDPDGKKIVDFNDTNLHVLGYSTPIKKKVKLKELKDHLFTIPEYPDRIPYRTSYYNPDWGFCLSHNQLLSLEKGEYEVVIDSSLRDGSLTYGECYIEGETKDEVLISCHICHPSLCNDNLSGIAVTSFLAGQLCQRKTRYSYRFLFIPATIGSITWLSQNEPHIDNIKHGLVATNLGDSGKFTYKRSRRGVAEIDQAVINILRDSDFDHEVLDFSPYGYDERQYCSPGFNLPVGSLARTPHGCYSEYHTSADNLDFVRPQYLAESFSIYSLVMDALEGNRKYLNRNPKCEPQLGERGLYAKIGAQDIGRTKQFAMLWVLNLSDGTNTLLDISDRSRLSFTLIKDAADLLVEHNLLREHSE